MTWDYLRRRIVALLIAFRNLGFANTLIYAFHQCFTDRLGSKPFRLHSRLADFPLWCRPKTTDRSVFSQIFVRRDYVCLDDVADVRFIVDGGANVGYTAAYLLSRFPRASLIAIEPESGNFDMLSKNLEPYGSRVRLVKSGIWSHPCGLVLAEDRGWGAWAHQVRECWPGEAAEMSAVSIDSLLENSGFERISILKLDVEGAEAVIFAAGYEKWMPKVENLAIELHGSECADVFFRAIGGQAFAVTTSGELTVCRRTKT